VGRAVGLRQFGLLAAAVAIAWCCGCSSTKTNPGTGSGGGTGGGGTPAADFTLATSSNTVTVTAGGTAQTVNVSVTAVNGFTGTVAVTPTGLPNGVTASPSPLNVAAGSSQALSLTAAGTAAAQSATLQLTGTSGTLSHSVSLGLTVNAPVKTAAPDFTLQSTPASVTLTAGGAAQTVSVSVTPVNGFTGTVAVTPAGLPAGVTATPSPLNVAAGSSQTLSLSAAGSATAQTVTAQLTGTSGTLSHNAPLALTVGTAAPPPPTSSSVDVTTYHDDVGRTGLNPNETTLTPANVNSKQFGLLRTLPADGKVDGEPLYLSNVTIGGAAHNVVYAVSEHDSVFAYDADTGAQLWKATVLGAGEKPSGDFGCGQITPEIGITSTPVIDRKAGANGTIFVVGMTLDGSGNYHQRLHALDVTTGAEQAGSPVEITAKYPGTGDNSSGGNVVFNPKFYAERAALLLLNGTIYMGWTSHCDGLPYTGWLMAYSESTLQQTAVLDLTPNGSQGSIWMTGAGPAADANGNIYFLDANGTFDTTLNASGMPAKGDFGNAFVKVSTAGGGLSVADYFEEYNGVSLSANDQDLGSGGLIVLPDLQDASGKTWHLAVGAGKDQKIFLVNRDSMGKFNASSNNVYQEVDGRIGGMWAKPAYFNNTVYYCGWGDNMLAFPITNGKLATAPTAKSANAFGYPGATPAVSANGTSNGIVWAVENETPTAQSSTQAVLYAYDATSLTELYDSSQAGTRDQFGLGNKFIVPLVVNGKVFVGTPNGVAEFGLLQ
jgi:hypothetical protein